MVKMNVIDWAAFILVIIGAINWGLYGLFDLELVGFLLGGIPILAKIVYVLVALSGLWMVYSAIASRGK
ncbi:Uncharacterised protein [Candidatus Tiddalikarchaeum anstoanum]|nr:Uncharacterised protein [Candidatus Tiddalikarchaeum anstoanum]